MKYQSILQYSFLAIALLMSQALWATHNRSGEMTYRQIGPLTIELTITTYTKISGQSIQADRPSLDVTWGDGSGVESIARVSPAPNGNLVANDIHKNVYVATHTYPGPNAGGAPYLISMEDPNRNDGIWNINNGNSVNIPFYLETEVYLFPTSIFGFNSSPILLEPPIDFGVVGQVFQHTPNGYDPDGDSIVYKLVAPQEAFNRPVPNWTHVDLVEPGANNTYTFDEATGLFTWTTPQRAGEYNIAIRIESYRNGQYIGSILRDIQITIINSQNTPPQIQAPTELCVEAGTLIDFDVIATDNDIPLQQIRLTATGGPLQTSVSPATFTNVVGTSPQTSNFRWQTTCDHVQKQPWQIVFKAKDTTNLANGGLATFHVLTIRVIAPPVQNLQANVQSGQTILSWDAPYPCDGAPGFLGFSVWRKNDCDGIPIDSCTVGVTGLGYTQLNIGALVVNFNQATGRYEYIDNTVQSGAIYSYRVQAEMATPIPNTNNFLEAVSGRSSEELCVQMAEDLPLITNVDVEQTNVTNGEILVRWQRPQADELDTIFNSPPYYYELYHSPDEAGTQFGASPIFTSSTFSSYSAIPLTLSFNHIAATLDTEVDQHSYRVAFFSNGNELGVTNAESSVYLTVASTDERNDLSWDFTVDWKNNEYVVFLETPTNSGNFTVLDTVTTQTYTHQGLVNGETYCYYVESIGTYGILGVFDPLLNKSQIACGTPLDTIPPCPPIAINSVSGCERFFDDVGDETRTLCEGFIFPADDLNNLITWQRPEDTCSRDLAGFNIYFAPYCNGEYQLINTSGLLSITDTSFIHQPSETNLAGCYIVTAVDSVEANGGGNESLASDTVRTDNCPFIELPNVFTPNGDNINELYHPCLERRFISDLDFRVYNRWGQCVFKTTDPAINWDGRNQNSGILLPEGVYFYTCTVNQNCMDCPQMEPLKGNIHLIYNSSQ